MKNKRKNATKLASGKHIGAWGLTEHNTGSDAGGMNTTAVKDGDNYLLNGSKNFITHGKSDVAVVIARTGEKGDSRGMSAFIVERGTPGFSSGKKEDKLGMRASETAELIFDNCRIPKENLIGNEGDGFVQSLKLLDGGRIYRCFIFRNIKRHMSCFEIFQRDFNLANLSQAFKESLSNYQICN